MLPETVRNRTRIHRDLDGNETGRDTVPADYGWKLTHKRTHEVRWIGQGDERADAIGDRLFQGRPEGEEPTHTIEKVGADGKTRYGPRDI